MQIILLHDVDKVGHRGESVQVANGYARNFLFPQGMAVRADTAKKKELEMKLKALEVRDGRDRETAETRAASMSGVTIKHVAAASDEGKLFGSVTSQVIVTELASLGHEVEVRSVLLNEPIRAVGSYTIAVKLHREVNAEIKLEVEASD
ncbi:50S ribosomal protein L9 [bacterium]|nr:MAG: 50S ribosomal protein L9 [bacterium]